MTVSRSIAGGLALVALGLAAGYLARGEAPVRVETRETARLVRIPTAPAAPAAGVSAEEVRDIVRAELSARPEAPAASEAVEPAAHEAVVSADRLLEEVAGRGVWTDEDRLAFRGHLDAATPSERGRLMAALARTLNEGARLATAGPPL
jgi:hypothetical protein